MVDISEEQIDALIQKAIQRLPKRYVENLSNVAFIVEDEPSPLQRKQLQLRENQTLFGLYEGVPLPSRQGMVKLLPDKITIFKGPISRSSANLEDLAEKINHTVWHEVAHYYGLDHAKIRSLE